MGRDRADAPDLSRASSPILTRRRFLVATAAAPLTAAFLAACGSTSSPADTAPIASGPATSSPAGTGTGAGAADSGENFSGIDIVVVTRAGRFDDNGTFRTARQNWERRTGRRVTFTIVSEYADLDGRYAGYIKAKDSSADVVYLYDAANQRYGTGLFEDLTGRAGDTSDFVPANLRTFVTPDGKLRGLPVQAEMVVYLFNRRRYADAGLDPANPPDTWQALYRHARQLRQGKAFGHVAGWLAPGHALIWFLTFYNSTGQKLLSDDRTRLLFDNHDFELSLQTMLDGLTSGFVDPDGLYLATSFEHSQVFFDDAAASTTAFCEEIINGLGGTPGTPSPGARSPIADHVAFALMPGVKSGGSGTVNGFEAFGVSAFSKHPDAAISFAREMAGFESQKSIALGTDAPALPPSRLSVLRDPDVTAAYPLADVVRRQGATTVDRYAAPYAKDMSAAFDFVLPRMFKKQVTVKDARKELVARTQKAIATWNGS